jgi:peroxiredoxin
MTADRGVSLGQVVRDFALTDVDGESYRLSQYRDSVVVIVFWSAECPVSAEYDAYFNGLHDRDGGGQAVVLGIDSNANYGKDEITAAIAERGVRFPVLRDPDCTVADLFGALTTPHVFIIDTVGRLVYAGAVDDRTFRQRCATVNHVDRALVGILADEMPAVSETQPYGCTLVRHT